MVYQKLDYEGSIGSLHEGPGTSRQVGHHHRASWMKRFHLSGKQIAIALICIVLFFVCAVVVFDYVKYLQMKKQLTENENKLNKLQYEIEEYEKKSKDDGGTDFQVNAFGDWRPF